MTSGRQVRQLTAEEIGLLRRLVEWRRENDWSFSCFPRRGEASWKSITDTLVEVDIYDYGVQLIVDNGQRRGAFWPRSLVEAVDVLAALGVVPAKFSTAFNAGRESALDLEEWRSVFPATEGLREYSRGRDRSVELAWLGQCRELHGDGCHLQHRRSGATGWEKVADAT